jgi:hypothetical protein
VRNFGLIDNRTMRFDTEFLRSYSDEHLWYELQMLVNTAGLLLRDFPPMSTSVEDVRITTRNALLESFCIHVRNWMDFFYPGKQVRADDVVAADFFAEGCLPDGFPQPSQVLEDAERRAHKQVSHLTTGRLPSGDKGKEWPFLRICADLMVVIKAFEHAADRSRLGTGFIERSTPVLQSLTSNSQ